MVKMVLELLVFPALPASLVAPLLSQQTVIWPQESYRCVCVCENECVAWVGWVYGHVCLCVCVCALEPFTVCMSYLTLARSAFYILRNNPSTVGM